MSAMIQDVVQGALKLVGLIDRGCYNSWKDFAEDIPNLFAVEIPNTILGIITSQSEPSEDNRNKLWLRLNTNGGVIGLYIFQNGSWNPFYDVANTNGNNEIRWFSGNSASPPDGWKWVTVGDEVVSPETASALLAQSVPNGLGGFAYYPARYIGF